MPTTDLTPYVTQDDEAPLAAWITKHVGGDKMANGMAAHDMLKYANDTEALQQAVGPEALDSLMSYIQEKNGMKDDSVAPRKGRQQKLTSPFPAK
jgi:hypothetical protein